MRHLVLLGLVVLAGCTASVTPVTPSTEATTDAPPTALDWQRCEPSCAGITDTSFACTKSGRRYDNTCLALCLEGHAVTCPPNAPLRKGPRKR
jgi:hypothetical protein